MHNNSNICIINPRIPRQTKKKIVFLWRHDDVITSLFIFSSSWARPGSGEEKKNFFFSAQNFTHFSSKIHRFPSSNINSSIQTQKLHKKRIIARTKQALIFEISSNELQKSQNLMGFAPNNILYKFPTTIGLENRESTSNEK